MKVPRGFLDVLESRRMRVSTAVATQSFGNITRRNRQRERNTSGRDEERRYPGRTDDGGSTAIIRPKTALRLLFVGNNMVRRDSVER